MPVTKEQKGTFPFRLIPRRVEIVKEVCNVLS